MKKITKITMVLSLLGMSVQIWSLDGKQIMQKNDNLPKDKTSQLNSVLVIIKGKNIEKKKFINISKRYNRKRRARLTFTYPNHIEFLTYSEPKKENSQWLKLSSGTVRKIASSDKSNSFVNSHFYYEDIGEKYIEDYRYKKLADTSVDGTPCYAVQAVKKSGSKVYSKTIALVRKNDFVILRVDFYEKGKHTKTLRNEKIQKIQGIYTPRKMVMQRTDGKGKSILYLKSIQYNIKVSDQKLKRAAL